MQPTGSEYFSTDGLFIRPLSKKKLKALEAEEKRNDRLRQIIKTLPTDGRADQAWVRTDFVAVVESGAEFPFVLR